MSLSGFEKSPAGESIRPILQNSEAIRRMEALSMQGRPALIAVADQIERVAPSLTNTEKQHVGRWLHRLLGPRGWRPAEKKRMPRGSLFSMAAVYRRVAPPDGEGGLPPATAAPVDHASRLRMARQAVRCLPVKPQSVKEFIAEKRRNAKREL